MAGHLNTLNIVLNLSNKHSIEMTNAEKIKAAKKRIVELEILIKLWSKEDSKLQD